MKERLIIFVLIILFVSLNQKLSAQVIKLENGISLSSIDAKEINVLDKSITTYAFSLGLDFFERERFYLSSELGYQKKGGKENNELLPDEFKTIKESSSYLHLNTTVRFPLRIEDNLDFFIGVGPELNVLMGSKEFESPLFEGYKLNPTVFGAKGEVGFVIKDFEKIRLGLNLSYLYEITDAGKTEFISFKNKAFQAMFSFGYLIR